MLLYWREGALFRPLSCPPLFFFGTPSFFSFEGTFFEPSFHPTFCTYFSFKTSISGILVSFSVFFSRFLPAPSYRPPFFPESALFFLFRFIGLFFSALLFPLLDSEESYQRTEKLAIQIKIKNGLKLFHRNKRLKFCK